MNNYFYRMSEEILRLETPPNPISLMKMKKLKQFSDDQNVKLLLRLKNNSKATVIIKFCQIMFVM